MLKNFWRILFIAALWGVFGASCSTPTPPPPAPLYPQLPSILESLAPLASAQGVLDARPYAPEQNGAPKLVILDRSAPRMYMGSYQNWNWKLPPSWLPASLAETDLVVVVNEREVDLGSKSYTPGSPITRYRWDLEVVVRMAHTGEMVDSVILTGPEPRGFPEVAPHEVERLDGERVSVFALEEWLMGLPGLNGQLVLPQPLRTLDELKHADEVTCVVFSPNGEMVASGSQDNTVQLWRVAGGEMLHTLDGHKSRVKSVLFSPDGETLASMSYDDIRIWRVQDGVLLRTLELQGSNSQMTISPDGRLLAFGIYDTVQIWRVDDGTLLQTLKGHANAVDSVAFSPDGKLLASGCEDSSIRLWRVEDGKLLRTIQGFQGYSGPVRGIAFSPDGQILAAADSFNVWFWQVEDGELLRSLKVYASAFSGNSTLAFSPNGKILALGARDLDRTESSDGIVQLWRVEDGGLLNILQGRTSMVGSVAFSPDGKMLATGTKAGTVQLWLVEPDDD